MTDEQEHHAWESLPGREQRILENLQAWAARAPHMAEVVRKQTARLLPTPDELDATAEQPRPRGGIWHLPHQ